MRKRIDSSPMTKRQPRVTVAALCCLFAFAAPAAAGLLEDGLAAAKRGDYATALLYWRPLADHGHDIAQFCLGDMYDRGQGVPQDYAQAVKWYRKAADQGLAAAQFNLGLMYENGFGVPQDYVQAHKWYNLAASRFEASKTEERNKAVTWRDLIAKKLNPAQIAEAQRLAAEWKPRGAE